MRAGVPAARARPPTCQERVSARASVAERVLSPQALLVSDRNFSQLRCSAVSTGLARAAREEPLPRPMSTALGVLPGHWRLGQCCGSISGALALCSASWMIRRCRAAATKWFAVVLTCRPCAAESGCNDGPSRLLKNDNYGNSWITILININLSTINMNFMNLYCT